MTERQGTLARKRERHTHRIRERIDVIWLKCYIALRMINFFEVLMPSKAKKKIPYLPIRQNCNQSGFFSLWGYPFFDTEVSGL